MPNYNYAKYIVRRIDSILRQTYPLYELIVLDDCSMDNSAELIEQKLAKVREVYPELKVHFVKNEENSGKAILQWKKGFDLATGDYVWMAEADDLCSKNFLEEVMKGFDDPDVVLSYAESKIINSAGLMIVPNFRWSRDKEKTGHYKKSYINDGIDEIKEIMAIRCTIPNVSAVVFKNEQKIPFLRYLDEASQYSQVGDWYFYTKVLGHGKISYNHKSLNSFRVHKGSKTADSKKDRRHFDEIRGMHKFFAEKFNPSGSVIKRMADEEKRLEQRFK